MRKTDQISQSKKLMFKLLLIFLQILVQKLNIWKKLSAIAKFCQKTALLAMCDG